MQVVMKLAYTVYEEEPTLKFLPRTASWPAKLHSSLHWPIKVSMQKKKKKKKKGKKEIKRIYLEKKNRKKKNTRTDSDTQAFSVDQDKTSSKPNLPWVETLVLML